MRRQGFAYVSNALNSTDIRLLPFRVSGSTDYVVELGPGYIGILSRDKSRVDSSGNGREEFTTSELLVNGDFSEGLLAWVESKSGVNGTSLYTVTQRDLKRAQINTGKNISPAAAVTLDQTIDTTSVNGLVDFEYVWSVLSSVGLAPAEGGVTVTVGSSLGGSQFYSGIFTIDDAQTIFSTKRAISQSGTNVVRYGGDFVKASFDIGATDTVYVRMQMYAVSGVIRTDFSNGVGWFENIKLSGQVSISDQFSTPWGKEADLALIQYVAESGSGRMYFTHPNYAPRVLAINNGSWSFTAPTLTGAPSSWTDSNWPAVVEFYQGRLWLAATPSDSSTIWGSKSGDPFNFTIGTNDDDGLEMPLSTTGGIKWLKGQKGLVVGTDIEEQVITSIGSLITPTDRKAETQSGWGSVDIQPPLAGNDLVYISQDRTKVRAINSSFNNLSWSSIDLTWVAEHITRERIIETIYVQNPNYQIYFLLASGDIVACTYDREHETIGWMRIVTDGRFLSITKTDSVEGTILWVGVRRNDQIFIEAIDPDESGWQFTDSWINRPIDSNKLVTGLDHLEGLTVQILVDGAIEPDQVVSGGELTVVNSGVEAVVGVQYDATMVTLPLGQGNKAGTALSSKRRYVAISVQLYDSALPIINGVLAPDRTPSTPMDTVEPNLTSAIEVRSLGWEEGGRVTITQNLPKKTLVTAIFGKADQEVT